MVASLSCTHVALFRSLLVIPMSSGPCTFLISFVPILFLAVIDITRCGVQLCGAATALLVVESSYVVQ